MFWYFWETTNPVNGLAPDRFPSSAPSSIAAIGFALTAYPIGVERGFISRASARERVLRTLQFLHDAPQGPAERGVSGYKGFFYHYLDMQSGERAGKCELSTIDTALLLAGILKVIKIMRSHERIEDAAAVHAQRNYAIANPKGWSGYGANVWGISACDGPAEVSVERNEKTCSFRCYAARGAVGPFPFDDGTLTPSVVLGALAVAPELSLPALEELYRHFGHHIYARYGFVDAFNPSFHLDVPLDRGRVIFGFGWVDSHYIGIDQGLAIAMVENYSSELIWRTMRKDAYLKAGLARWICWWVA